MRRTLKLFMIPAGKPARSPPEPGPDVELEAASDDALLAAAHEAITKRGLRARTISRCGQHAVCIPPAADPLEACRAALTLLRVEDTVMREATYKNQPVTTVASAATGALLA